MFKNKFIVCIKVNGKILRDIKDIVKLPFGTEFTILLKNLNIVRAQVSVFVDGISVTENVYLVIEPNTEFELTRFIKNGNLKQGNAFRFIEMTEGIEKHRGVKTEDGLVRVEFQFERPIATITTTTDNDIGKKLDEIKKDLDKKADKGDLWRYPTPYYPYYPYYTPPVYVPMWTSTPSPHTFLSTTSFASGSLTGTYELSQNTTGTVKQEFINNIGGSAEVNCCSTNVEQFPFVNNANELNDAGITVPGSEVNQSFSMVSSFYVEDEKHVIVLKLVGTTEKGVQYVVPVTVKAKPKCQTCGHVNKATSKFCCDCGTSLVIL